LRGLRLTVCQVIRNAGGSVKDALRSIVISQQLLGTREVLLVKHTDCGMITFQNSDATEILKKSLGVQAVNAAQDQFGGDFLPFQDTEEQVKKEIQWLKDNKAIAEDVALSGWIYDVKTGKVNKVI